MWNSRWKRNKVWANKRIKIEIFSGKKILITNKHISLQNPSPNHNPRRWRVCTITARYTGRLSFSRNRLSAVKIKKKKQKRLLLELYVYIYIKNIVRILLWPRSDWFVSRKNTCGFYDGVRRFFELSIQSMFKTYF